VATAQTLVVLQWSEEYSVGIERFDGQHRNYFVLLEKLYRAIQQNRGRVVIGEILGELYSYSAVHMKDEEDLLEYFKFPGLEKHREEHRRFRRQVREYMADFDNGNTAIALSLFVFMQKWLMDHMAGCDREYTSFLRRQGVE
jgi:hemerythrin-like metal-binding protein